ncbi:MAG TPA: efflux RND transporter permease subunit [Terriglobia bacterium]|nr:efflux RND transporter permease subunit [Terriglobia bacterium]
MSRFAIRKPYVIVVASLIVAVVGATGLVRMPVDLFPTIDIPEVVVATFYSGMPPEEVEAEITGRFERFFTLGSGIEHMESRSLPGVSLIKIYFQPGTNADADVTEISNLAMANLRRLPPGTLPPVVLKFDAASLPVCLVTFKGEGLGETQLRDLAQYAVRPQIASVPGATIPPPFGGRYRQIMVYVDPLKLQSQQLSLTDVVRAVNNANLILPAGEVKIGQREYHIYTNSQISDVNDINLVPLKTVGEATVTVGDVGAARDAEAIQLDAVRVDGQPSVYVPIMKESGSANTIKVVEGVKAALGHLVGVPKELAARVVFDQSLVVKQSVSTLIHEGLVGLALTSLIILVFLGSLRVTAAAFLCFPISALATFIALYFGGSSLNIMVLAGVALGFSRLIANAVIVLENIFRHLDGGEPPETAAVEGAREVALPVLAATLTAAVVFFPVTFLYGVSKFLFSALALAVVLSVFASYFVAMTVVPLYCARFLKPRNRQGGAAPQRFQEKFNRQFEKLLAAYDRLAGRALERPRAVVIGLLAVSVLSLLLSPLLGVSFFPRTDAGQFVINLKAPSGTRLEVTEDEVQKVEQIVRQVVGPRDLGVTVSNVGVTPGFSAIYTSNSAAHTAFVQVGLEEGHRASSYEYIQRIRQRIASEVPGLSAYFQSGGRIDAVLNSGSPAPIDVQVSGPDLNANFSTATELAERIRRLAGIGDVFVPQDIDYPALRLDIDRRRASELGLSQKEVVDNVITALTSNGMINPGYWIDPATGNDYLLTVQYAEDQVKDVADLKNIPLRGAGQRSTVLLDAVAKIRHIESPTEVDHYQIQRDVDVYVAPSSEDLGRVASAIRGILAEARLPEGVSVQLRGMVQEMRDSFQSFGFGLILSLVLLFLLLTAQLSSFADPWLVLLAVPMGLMGALIALVLTGTTLNIVSLMGVVMLVDLVAFNSILMVEMAHQLRREGRPVREAAILACRIRLRPILMTSLATIIGLLPMALRLGTGSEMYAPLAWTIIGGLAVSVPLTAFIVPAAYLLVYRRRSSQELPTLKTEAT